MHYVQSELILGRSQSNAKKWIHLRHAVLNQALAHHEQCHTVKNLLIIDETCHICFLSETCEGKAHDKSLADSAGYTLPYRGCFSQEMGFQGFTLEGMTVVQPKKKPRGGELIPPGKATNRSISSIRIRIEHAIGGVKR